MAWRDTLVDLRDELADVRARRIQRAEANAAELRQVHQEMVELSATLGIVELLTEMNDTLLEGRGELETIVSWEQENEDDDIGPDSGAGLGEDDAVEDDEDAITTLLSWEEDGDRDIAVEVFLDEEGIALHVNGVEIRTETDALEQALVEAFRDELEL
ncbi:MAG: hypothetical protein BZY75_01175 [SAR202 cluster bacterium Io17-Chloro-G7]|nr:MAG: hypothetical protein BZY75_01175 [SAR202 cluster bacterium Io17-Chloro-G7]